MAKVYVFLADGCEMVEALAVVDILRRADVEVVTVSVSGRRDIKSSHNVWIKADTLFEENDYKDADCLFLPGGMPGTRNLEAHEGLMAAVKEHSGAGRYVAAICAAPSILGHLGLLKGKKATCYPGFEKDLHDAHYTTAKVEQAGNMITGRGMGTAVDLGLKLTQLLVSQEKAEEIGKSIQYL